MNEDILQSARSIVSEYTGGSYVFDESCTDQIGNMLSEFGEGRKISFVMGGEEHPWAKKLHDKIKLSVVTNGLAMHGGVIRGAGPNAPVEDVLRIVAMLEEWEPDVIVAVGGGSAIDAAKAAALYWKLKAKFPRIETYEVPGAISEMFAKAGKTIPPVVAFMTSMATSHINCFANIFFTPEKRMLNLNDPALRPAKALFDPRWTMSLPPERVKEAAIEAFSHCMETYLTYSGEYVEYIECVCLVAMEIVMQFAEAALDENNVKARGAVAMASDIGGIALMTAKPNCGHLNANLCATSSHSTLCAVLNPYYAVFYSGTTGSKLAKIAEVLSNCGYDAPGSVDDPRALSESVAEALMQFYRKLKVPTKLSEIPGFDETKLAGLVESATKELARSGFRQLPVELNLINASKYLRLLYQSAFTGDCSLIMNP